MKSFLKTNAPKVLTLVLLVQAALFYGFSRGEYVPREKQLSGFAIPGSTWKPIQELELDKESVQILNADDLLSRLYQDNRTGEVANLFVAYFATQRTGKAPHSPKNCLPGTGWVPSEAGSITLTVPSEAAPITVNRYVVSRGQTQSVVLYWYQSHKRVVASEYKAKIYTVLDSIRYRRSDTALVRVVIAVPDGNVQRATDHAVDFVKSFFGPLKAYLPA
jgi:EpsI family protein